jgi:single-strand DNA-binding protein
MKSLNRCQILGNVVRDAETKFTPSGVAVSNFTVATNRRWKDKESGEWKEEAEFHRCVAWRIENVCGYLQKGKGVYLEGHLQTRSYEKDGEKRYSTEIVVDDIILLGGGERREEAPAQRPSFGGGGGSLDDNVPFGRYDVPAL